MPASSNRGATREWKICFPLFFPPKGLMNTNNLWGRDGPDNGEADEGRDVNESLENNESGWMIKGVIFCFTYCGFWVRFGAERSIDPGRPGLDSRTGSCPDSTVLQYRFLCCCASHRILLWYEKDKNMFSLTSLYLTPMQKKNPFQKLTSKIKVCVFYFLLGLDLDSTLLHPNHLWHWHWN